LWQHQSKVGKMSSYSQYKKWWMKHQAPHEIPSLYYGDTPEIAFRQHIKDMSLYQLMETLEEWEEEAPVPAEPSLQKLLNDMVEKFKEQHNYPPMEQTPSFPRPHIPYDPLLPTTWQKPQCRKCGMYLDKVMGYVCGDNHCPTFMKVTC
jgi:hypothetical protein